VAHLQASHVVPSRDSADKYVTSHIIALCRSAEMGHCLLAVTAFACSVHPQQK